MDIINAYQEPTITKTLVYLAKPIYGGWITFTVHLSKKYNYPVYKVAKRNESRYRNFGYDVSYKNITIDTLKSMENILEMG